MVKKITKTKIIQLYLNNYGKSYYLRELASLLGKPHQTIKPYVEKLVKDKILIKIERKNLIEFKLNFKNPELCDYLVIAEKEKLLDRLKEDTLLRQLFKELSPYFMKNCFVIFGSAVKKLQKGSDIDLLIIGRKDIEKITKRFENIYNKKIHLAKISNLNEISLAFLKEIYKKHLIINKTEDLIRFLVESYEANKLV